VYKNTGIYEIRNSLNGKRYVGSAKSVGQRWNEHRKGLRRGTHHSKHLQASWNLYGSEAFQFRVLVWCSEQNLLLYEQLAMDALLPEYNVARVAGNTLGTKRTAESRAKISAKALGRKRCRDAVERSAAKLRGVKLPPERTAYLLGNKHALGLKHTDEWKAWSSKFHTGRKRPKDAAYRAKIAASLVGRKHTPERRAIQAAAQLGKKRGPYKPWSEETRAKFRALIASRARMNQA
jgi:group I intron endonuclease